MKYKVTGQNLSTGARMQLELEADSKAAAERKAAQSGMSVNRVEEAGGHGDVDSTQTTRRKSSGGGMIRLVLGVIVLAALAWFLWRSGIVRFK